MISIVPKFAEDTATGIGAFNINLKAFLFQLVTFAIVLWVLKRWVLPKLMATMEQRRQTLEQSLVNAKATKEALAEAETRVEELLTKARAQADEVLTEARKSAEEMAAKTEAAAGERAATIIKDSEARLGEERAKLREELRSELASLVAVATEKVVEEKLSERRDRSLIERAIRSIAG